MGGVAGLTHKGRARAKGTELLTNFGMDGTDVYAGWKLDGSQSQALPKSPYFKLFGKDIVSLQFKWDMSKFQLAITCKRF